MTDCPFCRSQMRYVEQYSQWYCDTCRRYQEPEKTTPPPPPPPVPGAHPASYYDEPRGPSYARYQEPRPPQPARPPRRGKKSSKGQLVVVLAVILGLIFIAAIVALPYFSNDEEDGPSATTVNADQLRDDLYFNEGYGSDFKSFEPGDVIKVKDEIKYMETDVDEDEKTVTYIYLKSAHKGETISELGEDDYEFVFEGDITDEFSVGDEILITLHVTYLEDYGEIFSEVLNGDEIGYLTENSIKLISQPLDANEIPAQFPTVKITLKHGAADSDSITFKHTAGDPLDWTKFKIIITNNSDPTQVAVMNVLYGEITSGEQTTFNETNIPGFSDIDFRKTKAYAVEIYNIKENKLVFENQNIICE